jgi:hypothetical protein
MLVYVAKANEMMSSDFKGRESRGGMSASILFHAIIMNE